MGVTDTNRREFLRQATAGGRGVGRHGIVRGAGATLFHVVGGGSYYQSLPGYQRAVALAGPPPAAPETVPADPSLTKLRELRSQRVFVGPHNAADVQRGFAPARRDVLRHPASHHGGRESRERPAAMGQGTRSVASGPGMGIRVRCRRPDCGDREHATVGGRESFSGMNSPYGTYFRRKRLPTPLPFVIGTTWPGA